jgi:hypothetical protein
MNAALRCSDDYTLGDYVHRLSKTCPSFLVPYLRELQDRDIVSQKQCEEIVYGGSNLEEKIPLVRQGSEVYSTRAELHSLSEIQKRAELASEWGYYSWPKHLQAQHDSLLDARHLRTARHLLSNLDVIRSFYPTEADFSAAMVQLTSNSIPALVALQEQGLQKNELLSIARRCYAEDGRILGQNDLIEIKSLIEAGLEPFATRSLIREIQEQSYNLPKNFCLHMGTLMSWFSSENQLRIARAIDEHAPELWLQRPEHLIRYSNLTPAALSNRISENIYLYRSHYNLLHKARVAMTDTTVPSSELRSELLDHARKMVADNPELAFRDFYINQVYSKEQQLDFVKENLRNSNSPKFLGGVLWNYQDSPVLKEERSTIRQAVLRNPGVLKEAIVDYIPWSTLSPFLSRGERAELLLDQIHTLELSDVFDTTEAMDDILVSPERTRRLLDVVADRGIVRAMPLLIDNIPDYRTHRAQNPNPVLDPRFEESLRMIYQELNTGCNEHPFLVFNKAVRKYLEHAANAHIAKHLDAYSAFFPEELPNLHEHLPEDVFEASLLSHVRCIAILRTKTGEPVYDEDDIPPFVLQRIAALSPWNKCSSSSGDAPDRYQQILQQLAESPLYQVHAQRLERIAAREVQEKGIQPNLSNYDIDEEFKGLVQTVALAGSSTFAREHASTILALEPAARSRICQQLELAAVYSLDADLSSESLLEGMSTVQSRIGVHLAAMFDLEDSLDPESIGGMDMRLLQAMGIYYRARCVGDAKMELAFKQVLTTATQGTYSTVRAWGDVGVEDSIEAKLNAMQQLQQQGLVPPEMNLESYQKWVDSIDLDMEISGTLSQLDVLKSINRVIKQAVADHHIAAETVTVRLADAQTRYEELLEPLHKPVRRKAELAGAIKSARKGGQDVSYLEAEFSQCAAFIQEYRAEHADDMQRAQAKLIVGALRAGTVGDLSKGSLTAGKWEFPVQRISGILQGAFTPEAPRFVTDIRQIQDLLNLCTQKTDAAESSSTYHVTDRVDQTAYFLIGQDPVPSCQHYDSRDTYNRGLLSYVTDPNVKILQVTTDNKLVARAVLRLLSDEHGHPQLFMERRYSSDPNPRVSDLLKAGAIAKAQSVGIGLYSHRSENSDETMDDGVTTLTNNGSRSGYIYSDAAGGIQLDGRFSITQAVRLA